MVVPNGLMITCKLCDNKLCLYGFWYNAVQIYKIKIVPKFVAKIAPKCVETLILK